MWGQVELFKGDENYHEIIPTRVGTSTDNYVKAANLKDHPHAYGDKVFKPCAHGTPIGSSPRVWGQVYFFSFMVILLIIPSRMGTS